MFFRREKPRQITFENYLDTLRSAGFKVESLGSGGARVSKLGCAAILKDNGTQHPEIGKVGVVIGNEIGYLVDGGFQKFLRTDSGRKEPAAAPHLRALHDFQEDLKEALGLTSLYNQGLGTTSDQHMYDRVKGRDQAAVRRPWE
jgi:hypothetical protein